MRTTDLLIAITLLAAALSSGCAKDRSIDDWKRDQVDQQVSRIQAVSGAYRGTLYSESGEALGPLSVEMYPDKKNAIAPGGYKTDEQAVVDITVTYGSKHRVTMPFRDGYYDSRTGVFSATGTEVMHTQRSVDMHISGNVSGNRITGRIAAYGYRESGGKFSLVLNDALPMETEATGAAKRIVVAENVMQKYAGTATQWDGSTPPVEMLVFRGIPTVEERFLNIFIPNRPVQVTLAINKDLHLVFPDSEIDEGTGSLFGKNLHSNVPSSTTYVDYDQSILCDPVEDKPKSLRCLYFSSQIGLVLEAIVAPVAMNSLAAKPVVAKPTVDSPPDSSPQPHHQTWPKPQP